MLWVGMRLFCRVGCYFVAYASVVGVNECLFNVCLRAFCGFSG